MNQKKPFLNTSREHPSQHHKKYIGMEVPEGYFAASKQSILDLVTKEKSEIAQHHKDRLGMEIPEGYFDSSKQSILDQVKETRSKVKVFYLRQSFQIAASIAVLVALFISIQFSNTSDEFEIASNDVLIESLFVEDDSMNDFVEELLVSEVVEEAGKEKELENVLMNSLFVEDSLLEDYTKESLIENIVL
jgi:hypothetical protein